MLDLMPRVCHWEKVQSTAGKFRPILSTVQTQTLRLQPVLDLARSPLGLAPQLKMTVHVTVLMSLQNAKMNIGQWHIQACTVLAEMWRP